VTNGGYGAVHHALRWGLPLVVSGTSEDKSEVNARVEWSGSGVDLKQQHPSSEVLADAVARVLTDPGFRRSASRLGAAIAGTDALRDLLTVIDEAIGDGPATASATHTDATA
jgi:UDP:flavonoid glycosyltransferase YjiC (YdhE family)